MAIEVTRRHFAGLCAGLGVLPISNLASASGAPTFLSAYRDSSGGFGVAALDDVGRVLFTETLPARGHDTVVSPDGRTAVTFARRPGRYALVFDVQQQRPAYAFEAARDRHFYGHGLFSADGRLLLATENDYVGERGVIGIYDVQGSYRRIGEFATHGIGPHEALLLADGRTIVIANGGILTHPDYPRQKLNLPTMAPSLSYIDVETGDLVEHVSLSSEFHQLSIRHIDQASDGSVWFGGQYEGPATDEVPLIGRHRRGYPVDLINLPSQITRSFRQYIGSIKANRLTNQIAVTSPRGGVLTVLESSDQSLLQTSSIADVCGLTASGSNFAQTGAPGFRINQNTVASDLHWDNHLRSV